MGKYIGGAIFSGKALPDCFIIDYILECIMEAAVVAVVRVSIIHSVDVERGLKDTHFIVYLCFPLQPAFE